MKTIHPAIAEHATEENEKLRGLLEAALFYVPNAGLRADIDAALSQQAEPATAQDERDAVARDVEMFGVGFMVDGVRVSPDRVTVHYATRPAQTEQQPVAWMYRGTSMGDRLSFQCLNHYWRPKFGGAEHEYVAGIPLYAAPIAQTAPQPEQSWLYTCVGKGGAYELIGRATTAGVLKVTGRFADEVIVYRDTESNALYCREPGDFRLRMARAALATQGDKP